MRNGEQLGPFSKVEISRQIDEGKLSREDMAWHDKLTQWEPLDGMISRPYEPTQEPIEDWQIESLRDFGIEPPEGMTTRQAWEILKKCREDPASLDARQARWQKGAEEAERDRLLFPSYYLRGCAEESMNNIESEKAGSNPDSSYINEVRDEAKQFKKVRIDFWRATMHASGTAFSDSDELYDFDEAIDKLTAEYGKFFKTQTSKRVADILACLDAASPDWDRREPHSFYVTLKDNFPDAVKAQSKIATAAPVGKSGCFALLVLGCLLIALIKSIPAV